MAPFFVFRRNQNINIELNIRKFNGYLVEASLDKK